MMLLNLSFLLTLVVGAVDATTPGSTLYSQARRELPLPLKPSFSARVTQQRVNTLCFPTTAKKQTEPSSWLSHIRGGGEGGNHPTMVTQEQVDSINRSFANMDERIQLLKQLYWDSVSSSTNVVGEESENAKKQIQRQQVEELVRLFTSMDECTQHLKQQMGEALAASVQASSINKQNDEDSEAMTTIQPSPPPPYTANNSNNNNDVKESGENGGVAKVETKSIGKSLCGFAGSIGALILFFLSLVPEDPGYCAYGCADFVAKLADNLFYLFLFILCISMI